MLTVRNFNINGNCNIKQYTNKGNNNNNNKDNNSKNLLWDFNINTDYEIKHRRPDVVMELKSDKECLIINIAVAEDNSIKQKEQEKIEKYQDLEREIAR